MHMQATPCDGMFQKALVWKNDFMDQYRRKAGLPAIFA